MNKDHGDLAEMRERFETWDPRLQRLLSKVKEALKWKVFSMKELDVWVKVRCSHGCIDDNDLIDL